MAFKVRMKNMAQVSIKRVVTKLIATIITLWVGGTILLEVGEVMEGTCSPFYQGVTLIGWNLTTGTSGVETPDFDAACVGDTNTIDNDGTNGAGVLSVVGIIGLAAIVLEFVHIRF